MLSPAQQIAARLGISVDQLAAQPRDLFAEPPASEEKHTAVRNSPEMARILALPRRPAPGPDVPETVALAAELTRRLARNSNPYPGPLRPLQAAALAEAWRHRGLFGPIAVGYGKTLACYLMPTAVSAKRPLYVAPAALEQDVKREFQKYSQHWRGPHPQHFPFLSYETLSSKNSGTKRDSQGQLLRIDLLERLAPDLIVFDEAHKLRNSSTVCQKRVKRYLQAHPDTVVVALSGTMSRRSLKDFAHIARWCLREQSPVPLTHSDLEAWADALDEKDALGPRTEIGALTLLCTSSDLSAITAAQGNWDATETVRAVVRGAVRRRLVETPGCVSTQDGPLGVPLRITDAAPLREDPAIEEAFTTLRTLWQTPDVNGVPGQPIADGLELARHAKTLGLGFFQHWHPAPPEEWLNARRDWAKFCRDFVSNNRRDIDSEALVKDAVRAGQVRDFGLLARWEAQAPNYDPELHTKTEWLSTEAIDAAQAWAAKHPEGIIWVDSIAFGREIEKRTGLPYYGGEGLDSKGRFILDHTPGTPFVASKAANGTGRNLQKWSQNLFFTTPAEQVIGRTHRPGQTADVVSVELYVGCLEHLSAFYKELARARYAEQVTGNSQRLVYADRDLPELDEVEARSTPRWCR